MDVAMTTSSALDVSILTLMVFLSTYLTAASYCMISHVFNKVFKFKYK